MYNIFDKLKNYSDSDYYAFHMPGHKRNLDLMDGTSPYRIDITEIDGFDDLHHAEGILKEAQERAAEVYHADETHFLVNGSTVGILSAILGTTEKGDSILVARNCHKSVYHAIYLNELDPVYLYPKFDTELGLSTEIDAADVQKALEEHPGIRAVMIVSPTYDGVVSDIEKIAEIVHEAGCLLIVDEAHGAHFGFDPYFPKSANMYGADLVINSLHKTLPALTQTALLHVNGERVNRRKIKRYLDMLQTSSPSYILMASIDACIHLLEQTQMQKCSIFKEYAAHIDNLREELKKLKYLKIIRTENTDRYDRSKFVISVKHAPMSSHELYERLLHDYHLQMEMLAGTYVLAMTTVGDTQEGLDRLRDALLAIDAELDAKLKSGSGQEQKPMQMTDTNLPLSGRQPSLEKVWTIAEAVKCRDVVPSRKGKIETCGFADSAGHISLEYAYLYPPGSPLIVPGERITQEAVEILCWYREHDFSIEGLQSEDSIEVWIDG
ncbi:aminotransferase class I/II-fold pyridoxal phosphate-dependent enzyme [Dorea sp.]